MSTESIMKPVFDLVNEKLKDSDNHIVLLAIEFDQDGYPMTQSCRITSNPATSLAGLHILRNMIDDQISKVMTNLHKVGDASTKLDDLIEKLGFKDVDDPRFLSFLENNEKGKELKELILQIKKQFGK